MAEILSSTLLSVVFSNLFDLLAKELIKNFLRPKKVIKKLLDELETSLLSADKLLDDAEEKLIYNPRVEIWHNKLKDVVYKASELGDKIETEALRRNLEGHQSASSVHLTMMLTKLCSYLLNLCSNLLNLCSNPLNLCSNLLSSFDNDVKDELEEILSALKHLLSQKDALGLVPAGTGRSNYSGVTVAEISRVTALAQESDFFGRKDIKENIIRSLRSADVRGERIGVIPIIGAGGLGKTTLAQIIYNHPAVKTHFSKARAWVAVSAEFDLLAIAKTIIQKIGDPSPIKENEDQQELLFKLADILEEKKFLIVLDNVWDEDHDKWNKLKSCFEFGKHGSKIIVTARNSKVASVVAPNQQPHSLLELPEEDCRRLFEKTVFKIDQDRVARPDLQEIGKRIVEKCKGVPLSVKSVGAILRGNRDLEKWESILKSSVWELLQKSTNDIIPSLWLSYRYLPSEIKPCFAYCSIFPKGYEFEKEEVVQLWMAEGFLKNEAERTMEEVGKQYVEELISRSLFQRSGDDDDETIMMHDFVHDLAMYVSGKFCFWLDEDKMLRDLACETRHFSYNLAIADVKKFEGLSKAKRLHTFVGFELSYEFEELDILKVLEEVLVEGACLRVLSLTSSRCRIDSLPDSVGKLKHLRYLNLSKTAVRELPRYVGTLYNLQTLLLSRCENLSQLPESIGNLKQLRCLDLSYSGVTELPDSIDTLYNLQALLLSGCRSLTRLLESVDNLEQLRCLDLSYSGVGELPDSIGTLYNLQTLRLSRCENLTRLPESICNLKQLRYLDLSYFDVRELLDSINTLSNLQTLHLSGCENLTQLPDSIGNLKYLRYLNLSDTAVGELPHCVGFLYNLQTLLLSGCENLTKLPESIGNLEQLRYLDLSDTAVRELPRCVGTLYNLQTLLLSRCENLTRLPESIGNLTQLGSLDLSYSGVRELPNSIGTLYNLQTLLLSGSKLEFFGNCRYESLRDLEIKECEALKSIPLDCFPVLDKLTLGSCQNFESFGFAGETPLVLESITDLDLDRLPNFVSFPEGGLPALNLRVFSIFQCMNLRSLPQQMDTLLPSLNSLCVDTCGEIGLWSEDEDGLPSNLETLAIWRCNKLAAQVMRWDLQTVTPCLKSLEIDGCGEVWLDSFPPEGLLPTSLTSLHIAGFRRLKTLNIHASQNLKELHVFDCDELQCLPEESFPNCLSYLEIRNCPLLARRYRRETGEGWHKISHIPDVRINYTEQHES